MLCSLLTPVIFSLHPFSEAYVLEIPCDIPHKGFSFPKQELSCRESPSCFLLIWVSSGQRSIDLPSAHQEASAANENGHFKPGNTLQRHAALLSVCGTVAQLPSADSHVWAAGLELMLSDCFLTPGCYNQYFDLH